MALSLQCSIPISHGRGRQLRHAERDNNGTLNLGVHKMRSFRAILWQFTKCAAIYKLLRKL